MKIRSDFVTNSSSSSFILDDSADFDAIIESFKGSIEKYKFDAEKYDEDAKNLGDTFKYEFLDRTFSRKELANSCRQTAKSIEYDIEFIKACKRGETIDIDPDSLTEIIHWFADEDNFNEAGHRCKEEIERMKNLVSISNLASSIYRFFYDYEDLKDDYYWLYMYFDEEYIKEFRELYIKDIDGFYYVSGKEDAFRQFLDDLYISFEGRGYIPLINIDILEESGIKDKESFEKFVKDIYGKSNIEILEYCTGGKYWYLDFNSDLPWDEIAKQARYSCINMG